MIVFQKEAMILRFGQVSFEQTADKAEDVVQFVIAEPFDKCLQQRIVGKFLQIIHDGVLVIFAVEPEADQSLVGFNELMRMCGHGVGYSFDDGQKPDGIPPYFKTLSKDNEKTFLYLYSITRWPSTATAAMRDDRTAGRSVGCSRAGAVIYGFDGGSDPKEYTSR
jgi:hypothetical protein